MTVSVAAASAEAGSRFSRVASRPGAHGASGGGAASANATTEPGVALGTTLSRVGGHLGQVGDGGADHHECGRQEDDGQHERVVAIAHRLHGE